MSNYETLHTENMNMTYEEFVKEYEGLVKTLLTYEPGQVGCDHYCSKIADLVDAYPKFEQMYDVNWCAHYAQKIITDET